MSPVAALLIRPDGTAAIEDVEPDLDALRAVIGGGYLEDVATTGPGKGWHAYADDAGALTGLPENPAASAFLTSLGWTRGAMLRGPVVVLGHTADGDEADVPPEVVGAAVRLWGLEE